jgi:hypothetical protein
MMAGSPATAASDWLKLTDDANSLRKNVISLAGSVRHAASAPEQVGIDDH